MTGNVQDFYAEKYKILREKQIKENLNKLRDIPFHERCL